MSRTTRSMACMLAIVALVVACVAGCSQPAPEAEPEATEEGQAAEEGPVKVGYVTGAYVSQGSYEIAHYSAFKEMAEKYGLQSTVVENVHYGQTPEVVRSLAAAGNELVVTLDSGQATGFFQVAGEFPDVWFAIMSYIKSVEGHENAVAFVPHFKEAGYLCGVAGALHSETGKLGIVTGEPIPAIDELFEGWKQGAKSVRPDATVDIRYTQSWVDNSKSKEAALSLIAEGVDVLQAAIPADAGVFEAANEKGVALIGYYDDAYDRSPNVITSFVVEVSKLYDDLGKLFTEGALKAGCSLCDIEGGYITLAPGRGRLSPDIEEKVQEVIEDFRAGAIEVD